MRSCCLLLSLAACSVAAADRDPPVPDPPRPVRPTEPSMLRLHMHGRFDAVIGAEHALVHGRLDDMRPYARAIVEAPDEGGTSPWAKEIADVRAAAATLASAPSVDEGLHRTTQLAVACARCHVATGALPSFDAMPPAPEDRDTVSARMARHRWAAARLYEGMIGATDKPWRAGLDVLAAAPLDWSALEGDRDALARELQRRAWIAAEETGHEELEDRARSYGEILVTCAACHAAR